MWKEGCPGTSCSEGSYCGETLRVPWHSDSALTRLCGLAALKGGPLPEGDGEVARLT